MTDINIGLAGVAVIGTAVAGSQFGLPDWAVLTISAGAGSVMSAAWRVIGKEIYSWVFGVMAIITGTIAGIAAANLIVSISSLEPATATHFAFFFSFIGAKFTRALSTGDLGDTISQSLGAFLKRRIDKK